MSEHEHSWTQVSEWQGPRGAVVTPACECGETFVGLAAERYPEVFYPPVLVDRTVLSEAVARGEDPLHIEWDGKDE